MKKALKIITTITFAVLVLTISAFAAFKVLSNPAVTRLNLVTSTRDMLTTITKASLPKIFIVQSGSMAPAISTGSLVFTYPTSTYAPGDIITFKTDQSSKTLVTHRAVFKNYPAGITGAAEYITAGDANKNFDAWKVTDADIVGKVVLSMPYVGYLADYAKKPQGFIFLVIVPATIIVYEELKTIIKEFSDFIKALVAKMKKRRVHEIEGVNTEFGIEPKNFHRASIVLPIIGSLLILGAFSASYYMDVEKTISNVFGASDTYDNDTPPIPDEGHVVINEVYYDPDDDHKHPSNAIETSFEWIELYNGTGSTVNLKDWKVTDNSGTQRTISTSNRDLDPGQYAVLAKAANVFTLWSIPSEALKIQLGEIFGNGLANAGDIVILYDSDGNEIDRMSWGTTLIGFTPNCIVNCQIVSEGHSLQRITPGSDSDTDSDFTDTQPPTPGN